MRRYECGSKGTFRGCFVLFLYWFPLLRFPHRFALALIEFLFTILARCFLWVFCTRFLGQQMERVEKFLEGTEFREGSAFVTADSWVNLLYLRIAQYEIQFYQFIKLHTYLFRYIIFVKLFIIIILYIE